MALGNPYDIQRNRIRQDSAQQAQQQNDALKRRFASMGGLNSGSFLKAQERLVGQQEQNAQRAMEGVDVEESRANEAKAEADKNRAFAREERLGTQEFQAGENALGRKFATSEREAGQTFAAGEAGKQRDWAAGESALSRAFAKSEREAGQAFQTGERTSAQDFAAGQAATARASQDKQFNEQMKLARQQFALDSDTTDFNKRLSAFMAGTSVLDLNALGSRANFNNRENNLVDAENAFREKQAAQKGTTRGGFKKRDH